MFGLNDMESEIFKPEVEGSKGIDDLKNEFKDLLCEWLDCKYERYDYKIGTDETKDSKVENEISKTEQLENTETAESKLESNSTYVINGKEVKTDDNGNVVEHGTEKLTLGLTDEQKIEVKEKTDWSDEIIDAIGSIEEAEIYMNAELREVEVNGRKCLVREIDWDYVDEKTGMTNRERVANKLVPIDSKTGEKIELHHIGQSFDAPFAELTANSEHGDGNDKILHDKSVNSWRRDIEKDKLYNNVQKPQHWKARAEMEG